MQTFIGVKIVQAEPCSLGAYNQRRGWIIPANEDPERPGYYLRYPDGYQSWSPAEIFEGAYRLVSDDERALVLPAAAKGSFYDRLLAESKELEGRLEKLDAFLAGPELSKLPDDDRELLRAQRDAMADYAQILGQRIGLIRASTGQQSAGEEIEEGVRVTGGGQSEKPLPFRDNERFGVSDTAERTE